MSLNMKSTLLVLILFNIIINQATTQQLPPLNGKSVILGDEFGNILIYNGATQTKLKFFAHYESINQIKVYKSSSKSVLLAASASDDNTVSIWDLNTLNRIQTYRGHTNDVECVEFLDENKIASGSVDNTGIHIWEIASGKMLNILKITSWVTSLLLMPNGLLISGDLTGSIKAWNLTTGVLSYTLGNSHKGAVNSMEIVNWKLEIVNATQIATAGNDYKGIVWNLSSKSRVYTLNGHKFAVSSLKLVNSSVLATGSADDTIKLWKIVGKELNGTIIQTLSGHSDSVTCLDLYDSNTLMSSSFDQTIRFWNLNTRKCVQIVDTGLYINTFVVF